MPLFVGASESYDTDAWEAYNLKKENAELRKLLAVLWRNYKWATDGLEEPFSKQGEFADRMRELGVKVD